MQARICRRLASATLAAALAAASLAGAERAAANDGAETGGPRATLAAADARLSAATPSLKSGTQRATRSPARELRIRKPARVVAGDVLLAAVVARVPDRSRITAPPGWRIVRTDRRSRRQKLTQVLYLKVARSGDPAQYAWSFSSPVGAAGGILAYRGVDAAHPVDAHSGRSTTTARRRISAPSLTSTMPGSMIVGFFGARETMRVGPPPGATKRFGAATRKGSPASVSAADFVKPLPGATGAMVAKARVPRTARNRRAGTAQAGGAVGQQVALRPAGGAELLVAPPPDVLHGLPDLLPPDTAIVGGPSGTTAATSASFAFESSEPGSVFECRLDGGAWGGCVTPTAYAGLAAGPHTFAVRAIDAAGNVDPLPATRSWTIDATAPATTITSGPSGTVSSTSADFEFSASEGGSTFACRLDAGAWRACRSPESYDDLGDGSHTFEVRATDAAGNTDASPASRTWTIDTGPSPDHTPPQTSISAGPSGTTGSTAASFSFASSESGSTFECNLDGGGFAACSTPKAYSGLADGPHTFEVRATDAAGNTDASPAARSWTVDTVPPDTTITSGPSGTSTSRSASFEFTSTQTGSTFECRLDGTSWGACSSPKAYAGVTDGSHTFEVRAGDPAQNTDASPASRTWIVAGAPPGPGGAELPAPLAESTGTVFHVATTGSDSAAGSQAAPWATVQKALNTLQPGQKALVHAGTYTQALDLTRACTAAAPCTVQAAPGEARPVLRITNDHVLRAETSAAYWRISGFTFRDSNITSGGLVDLYGHHLELSNNELTASGDQDFYLDEASHHIQLLSNWMHHSGLGRTHQSHGAYLQGDDHLVANNLINDHPFGFGVQVYDKGLRSILVNNTITHNKHAGIVVGGSGGVSGVIVRNNILAYNEGNGLAWDGTCPNASQGTTYADHNVIFGNGSAAIDTQSCSATSTAGGNRFTDPLFADAAGRDLHLRAGSPAFGYALPEWAPATDRDGVGRPHGSGPDFGAYEDE